MRLPRTAAKLAPWAKDLIDECLVSRDTRRINYSAWSNYYFTGTVDGSPAKHNRCFSHIDKLASTLFSAADVRFTVESDADESEEWSGPLNMAGKHLNKEFRRRKCGLMFSQAIDPALYKGCCFVKAVWGREGYVPRIIQPQFMGVLREDLDDLDDQDAFVHSYYLTPAQFRRLLQGNPDEKDILQTARGAFMPAADTEAISDSYLHEIIMGGIQPMSGDGSQTGARGQVGVFGPPQPMLAADVAAELIRVDDLWVMDDEREDWTTIRYCEPGIVIEGKYKHRNLSDIPHEQPFVKVCPNEVPGYFWGRSEIASIAPVQDWNSKTVNKVDRIFSLQANPPRAFMGSNITAEKARALMAPGGILTDDGPGGKVETLAPTMPAATFEYLGLQAQAFDDVGGFSNILSGQGEQGVRTGSHANTLLRTSSGRMKDRALAVEAQVATFGDLLFKMSQAKNARVFRSKGPGESGAREFLLSQLPDDAEVTVDSHTSSPAFSGDNVNLAFALRRTGAIDDVTLIEMVHPPREDVLIDRAKKAAAEKAQFLAQHPELLTKGHSAHK